MPLVNGTTYDDRTPPDLIQVLERLRLKGGLVHVSQGDAKTGRDYLEDCYIIGRIGRSCGPRKSPLLVPKGDIGGPLLGESGIVRVRHVASGKILWEHPRYHTGKLTVDTLGDTCDGFPFEFQVDGKCHVAFRTDKQLRRFLKKLGLDESL